MANPIAANAFTTRNQTHIAARLSGNAMELPIVHTILNFCRKNVKTPEQKSRKTVKNK